jgi:GTP-binding protein HflX
MNDLQDTTDRLGPERAALVGMQMPGASAQDAEASLAELERLVDSAGAEVVGSRLVRVRAPSAATLISKGHVADLHDFAAARDCDFVAVDGDPSPVQQRNLERALGCRVVTRSEVILDIFAQHARTRESMTQVELAQLRYQMPRLIGAPIASARMGGVGGGKGGGIARRGPGETQLEVDRRKMRERIGKLEKVLERIERHRGTQRQRRLNAGLPLVGLVGYTNAGKSTLLNRLTDTGVLAEDRLFSTLDTTVRSLALPSGMEIGLVDTVGFVNHLPPALVRAFRATLEEIAYCDVILHVVDATSPRHPIEFAATDEILGSFDCKGKPRLTVWNKIDLMDDPIEVNALALRGEPSSAISALRGDGVDEMLAELERIVLAHANVAIVCIPYDRYDLVSRLHRECQVIDSRDTADGRIVQCRLAPHLVEPLAAYRLERWPDEIDGPGVVSE